MCQVDKEHWTIFQVIVLFIIALELALSHWLVDGNVMHIEDCPLKIQALFKCKQKPQIEGVHWAADWVMQWLLFWEVQIKINVTIPLKIRMKR